jgi:hypothetical protein
MGTVNSYSRPRENWCSLDQFVGDYPAGRHRFALFITDIIHEHVSVCQNTASPRVSFTSTHGAGAVSVLRKGEFYKKS